MKGLTATLTNEQHVAGRYPRGDFNTWETTPSGFLGGMPLAMLVGRGEQTMARAGQVHPFPENRVIRSDGRHLDPKEKLALTQSGLHHIVDVRSLLDHPLLTRPLYIHFDTDLVNPDDAPAMSYRASGGPTSADLQAVFQALGHTKQVVAVSMTTWTPQLDKDGHSQAVCMKVLRSLLDQ